MSIVDSTVSRKHPKPRYTRGALGKYIKLVSTASKGAVTDGE